MKKLFIASALFAACAWGQTNGTNISTFYGTPEQPVMSPTTNTGVTGTTTYCYWVVAIYAGGKSAPAGPACTFTANATLSASNLDVVNFLAPTAPLSAVTGYDVLRTTSQTPPTGACNCAVLTNQSGSPVNDTSNTLSNYTLATVTGTVQMYTDTMSTTTPTLTFTGATKSTSGTAQVNATIPSTVFQSPSLLGATAAASSSDFGSASASSAAEALTAIFIPANTTLTGACVMGGSAAATDKYQVTLRNVAGTLLASGAAAGLTFANNSLYNCQNFSATVAVTGPGTYFAGVITNGATANVISLYVTNGVPTTYPCGQVASQTFGAPAASITMPTSFTTAKCSPSILY